MIDLRSDTVSQPTPAMREAIFHAKVGDDTLRDDPTVLRLEERMASMLGKEDSVFMASGTMANQAAVISFGERGDEIILGENSHLFNLESGGLSANAQLQPQLIKCEKGVYNLEEIESKIRKCGVQFSKTALISIENTNDLNAGYVVKRQHIEEISKLAMRYQLPLYVDGARLFNAAVAQNLQLHETIPGAAAVMVAFTKGLSAPFGAILAGDKSFCEEARRVKQRLGGGFRQIGFMAAPVLVALDTMIPRIKQDHELAQLLANELKTYPLGIEPENVHTNIVHGHFDETESYADYLKKASILIKVTTKNSFRMVTHNGIEEEDVREVIRATDRYFNRR